MPADLVTVPLHEIAHGRAGDKGNRCNISVIGYVPEAFAWLVAEVTPERVRERFAHRGATAVARYELPRVGALNLVIDDVLEGGVNGSLNLDGHGKTLSFHLLAMPVRVPASLVEACRVARSDGASVTAAAATSGGGAPAGIAAAAIDPVGWIAAQREAIDRGTAGPVMAGELTVLLVEGRGPRRDYHVNAVDELFYQVAGDISVIVREAGRDREIAVRAGELWLAPAGVPHSPQRPPGTLGLVVERSRPPGSSEAFRWFCHACGAVVHEIGGGRVDPLVLRAGIAAFNGSVEARTCRACGTVAPGPGQ